MQSRLTQSCIARLGSIHCTRPIAVAVSAGCQNAGLEVTVQTEERVAMPGTPTDLGQWQGIVKHHQAQSTNVFALLFP